MAFHDIRFPESISRGSSGGPRFGTSIVKVDSKAEARNARWASPERLYDIRKGIKKQLDYSALLTFFMARRGAQNTFRFKDWSDYATTSTHVIHGHIPIAVSPTDVVIGSGDEAETDFPLIKEYDDGFTPLIRPIALPIAATVRVAIDSTETSNFTLVTSVDSNGLPTAVVRMDTAPLVAQVITAGFEFDVHARFGQEIDNSGLPGTFEGFAALSIDSLIIEEINDPTDRADFYHFGGATNHGAITADHVLAWGDGLVQVFDPSPTLNIDLPILDGSRPLGGPQLVLINISSTNSIGVRDASQTTLFTLPTDSISELYTYDNGGGSIVWAAR